MTMASAVSWARSTASFQSSKVLGVSQDTISNPVFNDFMYFSVPAEVGELSVITAMR